LGGPSAGSRDREMAALLDRGFVEAGAGTIAVARREPPAAPPPVVAEAEQPAPSREKPGALSRAASRVAARLSPIAKAEAAPVAHEQRTVPTSEHWSIQLGAFRAENAAEKAARTAASLPAARGKPAQIIAPARAEKDRLYRARLLNFTPHEAWSACVALHKKGIECSVIPPAGTKVASR